MKGKKEKGKQKVEKNQPGPSTSSSGTRLPPVVEWLTFTMKQLKTTSNIFVKEIEGVLSEWVDKNLDELLKEEYQASRITERVVKEFHQITTKTIATLQEQDKQTKIELKERFPWIEKLGRTHGKGGGKDKQLNGTDEKATKVPEATKTAGMSDAESDNELDIETDAFLNELKEKTKTAKAQSLDNNNDQRCEEKEADSGEELPDLADDDAPSKRTRKKKKNKIETEEVELSDEELGLSADSGAAKASIRAKSPVSADEVGDSDTSSSADKSKSKNTNKLCSKREKESDHGSGDEEDAPLNDSMDAETEESNDNNDDEPEIKRSKAKGRSRDFKKKQKDSDDNSKEIEEPVKKGKQKKIIKSVEVDKREREESDNERGAVSDIEEEVESDKGEVVESDKEEVVESDKEEVVESDKEEAVESDKEGGAESDKNEVVESDKEEVVESDKEEVVESDKEEVVESDKEETVESDKEEVEPGMGEVVESDKDEVVESDREEVVESDREEVVESDKEEVVESDKEEVVESDKEEVVESDKEEVVESDKEEVVESDEEEVIESDTEKAGKKKGIESGKKKGIESGKKKGIESGKKKAGESDKKKGVDSGKKKEVESGKKKGVESSKKKRVESVKEEATKEEEKSDEEDSNQESANGDDSLQVFSDDDEPSSPIVVISSDEGEDSDKNSKAVPAKSKIKSDDSSSSPDLALSKSSKRASRMRQAAAKADVLGSIDDDDSLSPFKVSVKKSNKLSAPFKTPKRVLFKDEPVSKKHSDEDSSDENDLAAKPSKDVKKEKSFPSAKKEKRTLGGSEGDVACMDDYKLGPQASYVSMETLSDLILDRLRTDKFVILKESDSDNDSKKGRRGRPSRRQKEPDDPLTKALKKLASFNPYINKTSKRSPPSSKSSKKGRSKSSRTKTCDDDDELVRDDQTTEGSSDDEPVLKRNIQPIIPAKSKHQDNDSDVELVGSDDEELDGRVSSSDEGAARKSVLRNTRSVKKELLSEDDEKKTKKSGEKRKKGGSYYTPQVCKVPELVDSEDSDDDFITKKRKLTKKTKKTVINSESEDDDDSSGEKKQHKSKYVELSSDSDNSDSDRNTRSSKKKRRVSSSDSDYQEKKKRRKRIKAMSDSDDDGKRKRKKKKKKGSDVEVLSGSDSDVKEISEDAGAKGRKKIRGIMDKSDLQRETRRAEEEEEKRKKRVVERQSQFNEMFKAPETEVIDQLVLDFDPESKEPLVSVDPSITKKLKPHQVKGITFMFDACFESVDQFKKPDAIGSGCILAHCMGLGKTLQTISFIHSVMTNDLLKIKSVLIMCPLNTVGNWNNELRMWLREADKRVNVHKLYEEKNVPNRVQALQGWRRRGGVGIMHYDAFRGLVEGKKIKKHHKTIIQECLLDPGPDVVICDEGHVFKNDKSKISVAVNKIRTRRRVVLTGTPLQNNLLEYHCMMQFVKPNLLGSKKEFSNRFVNPITNGQHKDSTSYDVSIMKKRAHVLHKLLDGCVQRLDYNVLLPYLPPKYEYVVLINMTEIQKTLYVHYLDSIKEHKSVQELIKGGLLLKHSANLAKVWCHPYALVLKHNQNNAISTGSESLGSLEDFIDDRSDDTSVSDSDVDWLDEHSQVMKKKKENKENGVKAEDANSDSNPLPDTDRLSGDLINNGGDWWSKFFKSKGDIQLLEHSSKMVVLLDIIKTCEGIQDKVLVFSQYLYSLNMIEEFLETMDEEAKKNQDQDTFPVFPKAQDFSQRWRKNIEYFRIDGSTKSEDRQKNCDMFNKTDTSRAKLFLISTKAGGLGINLVGANRVVIFDASWNPSQDMQSIFRVFRFGQIKPCYIYRLLAKGTIEEKIYNRQVVKLSLSGRVVDEHQIERHFTFDDMAKMYEFEPDEKADRPTPPVPKDRLLADLLMTHKDMIDTYLEHDSLLENIQGEELTEEERKVAWDEYQNEKNNLRNNMNMNMNPNMIHNAFHSMMTSATQIEVEQAYDKMKGKIREMYPHLSPEEFMMYTLKVQKDVDDLRKFTYQFHERHMAFTDTLRKRWIEVLQEKKKAIQTYFTIPGALQREMMSHYAPVNTVNYNQAPAQPIIEGPISVVPLSNILEQNSPYVPGNPNMHQGVYMNANNVRNMAAYRPSILHRGRNVIPTTTVPYTPTPNNQPSTSYSNEPIDLD